MDSFHVMVIAMMTVSCTVSTVVSFFVIKRARARQAQAFDATSEPIRALKAGRKVTGTVDGTDYRCEYFPGGKNAPASFKISIECASPGSFRVQKETKFERFFKNIGISAEIETGDREFDFSFYITGSMPEFASDFFAAPEKREGVRKIFEQGFTRIELDGKGMTASWTPFQLNGSSQDAVDERLIKTLVSHLAVLAASMPDSSKYLTGPRDATWKAKRALAFGIPITLEMVGLPALALGFIKFKPLNMGQIVLDSLVYSVPLLLVFLGLAVVLVKGRASSHRELIIVACLALFAFPLSGVGVETFCNGWLDSLEPSSHTVTVVDKYISKSDKSTNYYLVLESWRDRSEVEKLSISSREYQSAEPRVSRVTIVTKPGRFGHEWIVSREL